MSSIVEISAATTSVVCDASGKAQHVVNVHNISGKKLRVGARVVVDGDTKAAWVGPITLSGKDQQNEWDLAVDQTLQLTVPVAAKEAAPGKYTFRVEIYSTEAPSEDFTTGDGIAFEVVSNPPPPPSPNSHWWIYVVIAAVALAVLGGGGYGLYAWLSKTQVPELVGKTQDDAEKLIADAHLTVGEVTKERRGEQIKGSVAGQSIDPGAKVKKKTAVDLIIDEGAPLVAVPNVVGQTQDGATQVLQGAALTVGNVSSEQRGIRPVGSVLFQSPAAGTQVESGSGINLVIEAGPALATVPSVVGRTEADARQVIASAQLSVGAVSKAYKGIRPVGTVLEQQPTANSKVNRGSNVSLTVEAGPPPAPQVYKSGTFNVRQTYHADLDKGIESSVGADFWFEAKTATSRYVVPQNGANMARVGTSVPTYEHCSKLSLSAAAIPITLLPANNYVCFKTSEGRYGYFRVLNTVGPSPGVLSLSYLVWQPYVINLIPLRQETLIRLQTK